MSKTINIRGKQFYFDFAKEVSKSRFDELFDHLKPRVRAEAWDELLKATGRTEKKRTPKKKKKTTE